MDDIQRILIPTDFSPAANHALRIAVGWAGQLGAELHALHVVEAGPESIDGALPFPLMDELCQRMRDEAMLHHASIAGSARREELTFRCAVRNHDDVARAVLEYADEYQIDLVVMAPYGHRRGQRLIVGRIAETVVRLAPSDVITSGVRGLSHAGMPTRILVPVDLSEESLLVLQRARRFAHRAQARITILHVVEPRLYPGALPGSLDLITPLADEEAHANLEEFYERAGGPAVPHFFWQMRGRPATRITSYAEEAGIDLIIQGSHGRQGIDYAMLGSVAEEVVRRAPCPVLTMKIEAEAAVDVSERVVERHVRSIGMRLSAVRQSNTKLGVLT